MHDSDIARAYDSWADSYDVDRNATRDLDAAVMRHGLFDVRGRDVLEVGCGTGKNTAWLAEAARTVLALDFSPGMLARARARITAANVTFVQHDVREPWPAADASADLITGNLVLEHVDRLAHPYAEAVRVLRPGGRLFFCELHPERQRGGGQAQFTDGASGERIHVAAFRHTSAEFVNEGLARGLRLLHLGEWLEDGAPADSAPRLLSVLFEKP